MTRAEKVNFLQYADFAYGMLAVTYRRRYLQGIITKSDYLVKKERLQSAFNKRESKILAS